MAAKKSKWSKLNWAEKQYQYPKDHLLISNRTKFRQVSFYLSRENESWKLENLYAIPPVVIQTSLNFPIFNFRFLDSGRT